MMQEYIDKYRKKGILIDTNLLLVLFVGRVAKHHIPEFSRTRAYIEEDFDLLVGLIDKFEKIIITQSILAEVSNLGGRLSGKYLEEFFSVFANSFRFISEENLVSADVAKQRDLNRFGFTDIGIVLAAKEKYLVLTDDLKFYAYASGAGLDVINFNHIRSFS